MKVFIVTKRTSMGYEGREEKVISIYADAEMAIKEKNRLNKEEGQCGFKDAEFYVDSYNVIEKV